MPAGDAGRNPDQDRRRREYAGYKPANRQQPAVGQFNARRDADLARSNDQGGAVGLRFAHAILLSGYPNRPSLASFRLTIFGPTGMAGSGMDGIDAVTVHCLGNVIKITADFEGLA